MTRDQEDRIIKPLAKEIYILAENALKKLKEI